MQEPPKIRNITVSGRIGAGATTLAKGLSSHLDWELLEGGELFEKFFNTESGSDTNRPDSFDLEYEKKIYELLTKKSHRIIQSHLAGFDAQGISGVFKIIVLCENEKGEDLPDIRAQRLIERKGITQADAEKEVHQREQDNLEKWRRLYAPSDPDWVYWDKKYYDLVINTADLNKEESLALTLSSLEIPSPK